MSSPAQNSQSLPRAGGHGPTARTAAPHVPQGWRCHGCAHAHSSPANQGITHISSSTGSFSNIKELGLNSPPRRGALLLFSVFYVQIRSGFKHFRDTLRRGMVHPRLLRHPAVTRAGSSSSIYPCLYLTQNSHTEPSPAAVYHQPFPTAHLGEDQNSVTPVP